MVKETISRRSSDEKIAKMEIDIEHIKQNVSEVKSELKESHQNLDIKLDKFMERIDNRFTKHEENEQNYYAAKWVEEFIKKGLYIVMGILVTAFMYLILK